MLPVLPPHELYWRAWESCSLAKMHPVRLSLRQRAAARSKTRARGQAVDSVMLLTVVMGR